MQILLYCVKQPKAITYYISNENNTDLSSFDSSRFLWNDRLGNIKYSQLKSSRLNARSYEIGGNLDERSLRHFLMLS